MHLRSVFLPLISLVCLVAHAQESPPTEAQKYHEALLKHPNNPVVFSRFYDAWIDAQSIESLQTFLEKRAETHGGIDYVILARYQLLRGQDPSALASLNKAIETLPNDPALLLERANLLIRTLEFVNARKDLEAVSKLGNEALSIEASKLIGKSYLREGNPEAAIQAWEKILTTHPKNEDLLEDLVELASSSEQPDQALKYSEKLIAASTDPYKKALRLIRRGELLAKSGENDKAIALWSETLSQTGEGSWLEREILAYIEQSLRRQDRIDLLSTKFEELANAHPRRLVIHRELAKLEAAAGNIDSAIGRFREVLRRSPGETELREEFIRLLITSERFDDASAEIGKILSSTPNNPELHLRLADLAFQKAQLDPALDKQTTSAEIHNSLEKAREFLDPTEASGLRIANLMIRYGLEADGETLLKQLAAKPDASSAPAEALATEYTRTKRISKSLEILTELAKSPDPETVLRATNSMAPLTKAEIPFNILLSRLPDFPNNNPYIAALIQASLAAKKPADAIPSALKLVRSSKLSSEIQEAAKLATAVITAAEKAPDIITELSAIENRSNPEICLLAALLEIQKDHGKSDALFANTTEPTLLRFHSSLLSVRGDFKAAIASLNRLAETSADNSASYFKELSDLQLRSGDSAAALKTIEQWKIAAPTDKTPWTIASRLLRESGKYDEALETTRRALSRFNTDEDLTASLADLYQETGDRTEAERIFWKLYDQAPDTNSQSRWAARLAKLASNQGETEELREKFLQRSRSNNQSIGPILALVELARVTSDEVALLEYLYQALRIKPKDIDIRLQVASVEKQSGNLEKQMAILNEGIDHDATGRIRTSLAQAFIDQGQVIKGMHMLRALNGEGASDPRFIETSANSIAGAGLVAEAIQYLEESLPPNSDWRSRFLLADLLQKDGREFEATTILLSLMEAKDEIAGLMPNSNFERIQQYGESKDYYFQSLINIVSQEIYRVKNSHRSSGSQQQALPASLEELRFRSKILLAFIANIGNPVLKEKITTANIKELTLIADIIACYSENGIDYLALLEKHPTHNDLIKLVVQQGRFRNPNTGEYYSNKQTVAIYQKLLASPTLDQGLSNQITLGILQSDPKNDEAWDRFFAIINESSKQQENSNNHQINYQLQNLVATQRENIPSKHLPKIKEILLKNGGGSYQEIGIFLLLGEIDPWINAVNKIIAEHQKQYAHQLEAQKQHNVRKINALDQYGFYPQIPQIRNLPLTSINTSYLQNITPHKFNINENRSQGGIDAKDLIQHLDRFESPVLRAWIAINADDQKAIKKTLSVKPSELEANDFTILKLWLDIEGKRYSEACRLIIKLSNDSSIHQHHVHWLKMSFLSIINEIPADKRGEFLTFAREIINSYSPPAPPANLPWRDNGYNSTLLQTSKRLGFEDLVVRFTPTTSSQQQQTKRPKPPTKANNGTPLTILSSKNNSPQPKQRPVTPIERFEQFSSEGKHLAAAHEFLNHVQTQKKQGYELSYIFGNTKMTDEARKEIISISDPGKNPSLSKRLEFVEICLALKETDTALTILRALSAERPFDSTINIQLALNLPEKEIDTAANILKQNADSHNFYTHLNTNNQRIHQARNNSSTFQYFSLLTRFLEISDPEKFEYRAFSEINNHIYYFLTGNNLTSIPSLIGSGNTSQKETPDIIKHREISRRLTTAMLRHPLLAESGFRYMRAAKWIEDPKKIDELARTIILLETQQSARHRHNSSNLPEFSAASWISDRLKESKSHNEIIPAEFLASIEKNDPILASLFRFYSSIKTTKDIAAFWDSGAMHEDNYQTSRSTIQLAVLEKIASTPGANDFFVSRIKALSQNQIFNSRSNSTGEYSHIPLIRAALTSCKDQNETSVNNLCKAIIHAVYGENFNFNITNSDTNSQDYQLLSRANSIIDSLLNRQSLDPVTAVRVFQAFDSHRVPMQNYYWIQNVFQKSELTDPKLAIEFLDSMGFLKNTANWKPIAYSSINTHYDQIAGTSTFSITRNLLNETITQSFNYRMRNPEFVTLLENRTPQTFGSLVTAALLSNDSAQRERLMLSAFKHAAPQLAKASPNQLEDFNLLVTYLPSEAITILPPKLQIKVKERNAKLIAEIEKNIDQKLKQIEAEPSIEPFGILSENIIQLAVFDLEKSIGIFNKAHAIHKTNIPHYLNYVPNIPKTHFGRVTNLLGSNRKINPAYSLKFYRAIISGPNGHEFGHTDTNQSSSHLQNLGYALFNRLNPTLPKNTENFLRPWLIASQFPEDCQHDALAAIICYSFHTGSFPTITQATITLDKTENLTPTTRNLMLNCIHIANLRNLDPENQAISANHLSILLNNPIFDLNTRTQIALSILNIRDIILFPSIAKIYADLLSDLSKQDNSMVNKVVISTLRNLSTSIIPPESLPHLKIISEVFWDNANSTKTGGHPNIHENDALELLLSAIKVGDIKNTKLIIPKIRDKIVGNINILITLIQLNELELADDLLPDESSEFFASQSINNFSNELKEKLSEFSATSKKPESALRLEFRILMIFRNNSSHPTSDNFVERKKILTLAYLKNPPKNIRIRTEMLAILTADSADIDPSLENEICALAELLDPKKITSAWLETYKSKSIRGLHEEFQFNVICSAAMIQLLNDEPSLFISICNTLTELIKKTSESDDYHLRYFIDSFNRPACYTVANAVCENKTKSFSKILSPLRELALTAAGRSSIVSGTTFNTIALFDFISNWENQPNDLAEPLKQINNASLKYTIESISHPRKNLAFIFALGNVSRNQQVKPLGANPEKLLIAILSKDSLSDILPTTLPWLTKFEDARLSDKIVEIAKSPPKTITPAGLTLLRYHTTYNKKVGEDAISSYQTLLQEMPASHHWDEIRISSKLRLANEMLKAQINITETRAVLDSIDPKSLQQNHKSYFDNLQKNIQEAEAKQQ